MSLSRWTEPHFKHTEPDARTQRHVRKAQRATDLEAAYEEVNRRDGNKSRVSGVSLVPGHVDDRYRREHNHIEERSRNTARREDPTNIHLCSALEHHLITVGKLLIEGTDASLPNKLRFHWAASVPADQRVIKIRSRRWSQE